MKFEYIENNILKVYFENREELNKFLFNCDLIHHSFNIENDEYWDNYPEIRKELVNYEPVPFDYRFHRIGQSEWVLYVGYSSKYLTERRTNDIVMTEDALQYPDFFSSPTF